MLYGDARCKIGIAELSVLNLTFEDRLDMLTYLWVIIPLAGIAYAAFSEWLKFKKQTARIGSSTVELGTAVEELRAELQQAKDDRANLIRRIQNLETIVTSEAWDALGTDRDLAAAKAPRLSIPDEDQFDDADRAERMAKKLRG
jgi:hypothetical protein